MAVGPSVAVPMKITKQPIIIAICAVSGLEPERRSTLLTNMTGTIAVQNVPRKPSHILQEIMKVGEIIDGFMRLFIQVQFHVVI